MRAQPVRVGQRRRTAGKAGEPEASSSRGGPARCQSRDNTPPPPPGRAPIVEPTQIRKRPEFSMN